MLRNQIIIIHTSSPLKNYMKRRPTHYAEILSRTNRVINLSSTSHHYNIEHKNDSPWEEKIYIRLPGTKYKLVKWINNLIYKIFIKRFFKSLPQPPILWHFYSGNSSVFDSLDKRIRILEICDDTPEFFPKNSIKYKETAAAENRLMERADLVFTISDHLKNIKAEARKDILVVRNGVNYDDFASVPHLSKDKSDELFPIKSPVVGYTGAVSHWMDFGLIDKMASEFLNVSFVFVGRIDPSQNSNVEYVKTKPNIFFVGEKPYSVLPHYLKYFDLSIIPFSVNMLTLSVNPIKLYEYLAAGIRVLSISIPEVNKYKQEGIIETYDNQNMFVRTIRKMLLTPKELHAAECQKIARQNSWESRVQEASLAIEKLLEK